MPRTDTLLKFEFDELPLITVDGFAAGLVAGMAEISYDREGLWSIASISLEGSRLARYSLEERVGHEVVQARLPEKFRRALPAYLHRSIKLDAGTPLYSMISATLEGPWASNVQNAIRDDMIEDRVRAADHLSDLRRERVL